VLPNPKIIRITIDKVLKAFGNVVQVELLKVRREEIKRLQFELSKAYTKT